MNGQSSPSKEIQHHDWHAISIHKSWDQTSGDCRWQLIWSVLSVWCLWVTRIQAEFVTPYSKLKSRGSAYQRIIEAWPHKAGCYLHVCVIFCPHSVGMLLFTYQGKDWHSFTPSVCLTEVWKATVDKRMVSKGMWLSQYAPKGVKSQCITSSQTVYVRKPDLVSSKTLQRLGGRLICEIYLNTYFQRARLGGRLICELDLYASIYGTHLDMSANDFWQACYR